MAVRGGPSEEGEVEMEGVHQAGWGKLQETPAILEGGLYLPYLPVPCSKHIKLKG